MKTIGRHLIAEFYGCDADVINSLEDIKIHMCDAAVKIGATVSLTDLMGSAEYQEHCG